jgi:ABC-type amino acid transport substrate-binding protein
MMNKWKKIISFAGLFAAIFVVLAACADSDARTQEASDEEIVWEAVNVATTGGGPPYSLIDDQGNWTGTEAELWESISERTGWDIEVQRVGGNAIFGQLDTGRSDVAANNYAWTEERAENYIHTRPLYGSANSIATKEWNDEIQEIKDLAGKRVAVMAGQAADIPLTELSEELGFEVVRYESTADAFQQLEIDQVDAAAGPRSLFMEYIASRGVDFRILDEDLFATQIVYFLPDTEEHAVLRDELNVVIEDMLEDGTIAEITEKWLYTDMTQYLDESVVE